MPLAETVFVSFRHIQPPYPADAHREEPVTQAGFFGSLGMRPFGTEAARISGHEEIGSTLAGNQPQQAPPEQQESSPAAAAALASSLLISTRH